MALLWLKQQGDCRYEVRSAGNTLRLYTNGVFHSQYNPMRIITGSVWDLMLLPALLMDPETVRRILVLGVGGGAVIHQLNTICCPQRIVGIELNPIHLQVARCFFNLKAHNIALYEADAVEWAKAYRGPGFDLVIDDLFCGEHGEARRAVMLDSLWYARLQKLLNPRGSLVVNFASSADLLRSCRELDTQISCDFKSCFQLTTPGCENAVGVLCRQNTSIRVFKQRMAEQELLQQEYRAGYLRYRISRL